MAQELDGVVAVIGIESPIYADPDWRADDLDELARYYVEGVRQHQAKGPYSLLGWSHGGLIAVAMAHQLRQDGQDVDFIGLVDVAAEIPAQSSVSPTSKDEEVDIAEMLNEIKDPRWDTDGLDAPDIAIMRQAAEVIRHQDALVHGYRIPRLDVPLTVWWASESLPRPKEQLDWSRHTTRGVRVKGEIDTDHKTIIRHTKLMTSLRAEFLTAREYRLPADHDGSQDMLRREQEPASEIIQAPTARLV